MSSTTEHSEVYGDVEISYVCTGIHCGYWLAKTVTGEFICTGDTRDELEKELHKRES